LKFVLARRSPYETRKDNWLIIAGILLIFAVLFILAAFSAQGGGAGSIIVGVILAAIAFGIIWFVGRQPKTETTNVTVNVELPGNVSMDTLKCKSCGGTLSPKDVNLVAGAPVVTCPYCNTTYQLTEEPKW